MYLNVFPANKQVDVATAWTNWQANTIFGVSQLFWVMVSDWAL